MEPSSPETNTVELKDCVEELLKFTLQSHVNNSLEFDIGISKDLCFYLLKAPNQEHQPTSHSTEQVPSDALYKHLASVLYDVISSGAIWGNSNRVEVFGGDVDLIQKQEWDKLILDRGTELLNICKKINFQIHVQEPYFTQLKDGLKTVEGRCAVGDYNRIEPGAFIIVNRTLVLEVQDLRWYASFSKMLEAETLPKVLPGVKTIEEGVEVYRKFYTKEKEKSNGVYAICVAKSAIQPCIPLAKILSGLGYRGLESILGESHLEGVLACSGQSTVVTSSTL